MNHFTGYNTEKIELTREMGWDASIQNQTKEYNSDLDSFCPLAQIRKFNHLKRTKAANIEKKRKEEQHSMMDFQTKLLFKNAMPDLQSLSASKSRIEQNSADPDIFTKTMDSLVTFQSTSSETEIEALKVVILREKLLFDFKRLVSDNVSTQETPEGIPRHIAQELDEYIQVIRSHTVMVVESISRWLETVKSSSNDLYPFYCYRGDEYCTKMFQDMNFLSSYPDFTKRAKFLLPNNPMLIPCPLYGSCLPIDAEDVLAGLELWRVRVAEELMWSEMSRVKSMVLHLPTTTTTSQLQQRTSSSFLPSKAMTNLAVSQVLSQSIPYSPPVKSIQDMIQQSSDNNTNMTMIDSLPSLKQDIVKADILILESSLRLHKSQAVEIKGRLDEVTRRRIVMTFKLSDRPSLRQLAQVSFCRQEEDELAAQERRLNQEMYKTRQEIKRKRRRLVTSS